MNLQYFLSNVPNEAFQYHLNYNHQSLYFLLYNIDVMFDYLSKLSKIFEEEAKSDLLAAKLFVITQVIVIEVIIFILILALIPVYYKL